jgi:glycine C-acetyltransferase
MNLKPYFHVAIPVLLWSMQTTSTSWFLRFNYSPVEVALYRSVGAILFALAVAGGSAYRGFQLKQFVPGICLALNFLFFTLALNIANIHSYHLFGPLLMTVEASNFVFCLPILWVLRKPAQVTVAALMLYILGMVVLVYGALQNDSYGLELLLFSLLTSFTFGLFNCTLDLAGKGNNRSVALMLPILVLNLGLALAIPRAGGIPLLRPSISSVEGWVGRIWSWNTLGLLMAVGFVQTGAAYFFWSKARQRFSPLTLSLSFLWTVPIAYIVTIVAKPLFVRAGTPMQNVHDFRILDALAVCLLIAAFICDNSNLLSGWGRIVFNLRRSVNVALAPLDKESDELAYIPVPEAQSFRNSVSVQVDGREMTSYATSDYLGLASEAELRGLAAKLIQESGWGFSLARPGVGTRNIHNRAEKALANLLSADDSILFPSAYAANLAAFEWLRAGSVILYDELCHGSLKDGIRLSNADALEFRHLDLEHLEDRLNRRDVRDSEIVVIVTDGVFSSTGEVADLRKITDLAKRYNCLVAVDDTHGTGVLGTHGGGTPELQHCVEGTHIIVTSLAKALGCPYGGVLAGRHEIVRHIRAFGHSYRFSNPISPVVAAMAIKAVELVRGDGNKRAGVFANLSLLKSLVSDVHRVSHPMFAIRFHSTPDNRDAAKFVYSELLKCDIFPSLLEPPYTPTRDFCVRFQLSALHTQKHIEYLAERFAATVGDLKNSNLLRSEQVSTAPSGSGLCF